MASCAPVPCQLLETEARDTTGRADGHLLNLQQSLFAPEQALDADLLYIRHQHLMRTCLSLFSL